MTHNDIRRKYIDFFVKRGHKEIPSSPLVPENDPSSLFTSSGMQPLINYLLGDKHPLGTRLTDSQKCFRAQDIEEVGDNRHTTFFEMLGNWSLGDYFKEKQLSWIFEFLTQELDLEPQRLYVTVFEGNTSVSKDTESIDIWKEIFAKVGINAQLGERIFEYPAKKNWWSRSGVPENMPPNEPGGPDSEVFFEFTDVKHDPKFGKECHPNCDCGRFMEIANSVFMQYQKQSDGTLKELPQKNVDFGGGLERMVAVTRDNPDIFYTDLFIPIIAKLQELTNGRYKYNQHPNLNRYFRLITDHIKAAIMLIGDDAIPSNKEQGYVVRRLLRRAIWYGRHYLFIDKPFSKELVEPVVSIYKDAYPELVEKQDNICLVLTEEETKFLNTIDRGTTQIPKLLQQYTRKISVGPKSEVVGIIDQLTRKATGDFAFNIYETYGFPPDLLRDILIEQGWNFSVDFEKEFQQAKMRHQTQSRSTSVGMFKGGLADQSAKTTKLHTATHLLQQALRDVLGHHVRQKGSNITAERLRFDFSHSNKLTNEEISRVEITVNEKIKEKLKVTMEIVPLTQAIKNGALTVEGAKYPDKVKVYSMGNPLTDSEQTYSKEVCGGPHVSFTGTLGSFKIIKEEAISANIRRIYAILE